MLERADLFQTYGTVLHAWPTLLMAFKGKGNIAPFHAMKACRGNRGIAPFILIVGTRRT
jgi:energy-converting hydrogenase Eha subunit H